MAETELREVGLAKVLVRMVWRKYGGVRGLFDVVRCMKATRGSHLDQW